MQARMATGSATPGRGSSAWSVQTARSCTTRGGARASRLAEQVEPSPAVIWGARRGRWQAGLDRPSDHRPSRSHRTWLPAAACWQTGASANPGKRCAGGCDRFRTCGPCRVNAARPPRAPMRHLASHHISPGQRPYRTEATWCCAWRCEASFLANCWQRWSLPIGSTWRSADTYDTGGIRRETAISTSTSPGTTSHPRLRSRDHWQRRCWRLRRRASPVVRLHPRLVNRVPLRRLG
jgi:hypothetical protein